MTALADTLNASSWLLLKTSDSAIGLEVFIAIGLLVYATIFAILSCFDL